MCVCSWINKARSRLQLPDLIKFDKFIDNRLKEMKNQQSPVYKNQRKLSRSNKIKNDNYSNSGKVDYKPLNHKRSYY